MASMGLQGGTARCYDWWMDYLKVRPDVGCTLMVDIMHSVFAHRRLVSPLAQCLDESKAPMVNIRKQECKEWLEDYNECLHRQKQVRAPFMLLRSMGR